MQQIENTLYVMTQGAYAHLENDTVRIDVEREKRLQVPLHHLGAIVCFGNVLVSPRLMHRCADDGKALVLLSEHGRFKARMEGPVSGNILLRQAQHQKARDVAFCLDTARAMIAGKIRNSRQILLRGAREAAADEDAHVLGAGAEQLANAFRRVPHAVDLEVLRGIEGEAAKNYFDAVSCLLRHEARQVFSMNGRTRRPPRDRMNALLSFLYAMLMNDCRSAVEASGLDPQLGFLHVVRPGRAALALDLMEELRPWVADRLAMTLVNRGQVRGSDFDEREGGAVLLSEKGRKVVVTAYQERKQEKVTHPLLDTTVAIGVIPFLQARFMARTLRGDMAGYLPFVVR
ncbi:MAG: type I-C CRISPR-associated endonuclease Cas1 [Candidatus Accumulibacter sp.]|uniref:type I-C CRISPR-associated endonuclease Cas1c n=1 Tax=Accumulibacter sp. TaxID=2053492 RepID=UPI001A4ECA72|nr:type I-C CRISPR-associated endonuclease Cas1c [Accumulibacter sp.]MBL8393409.1 type I-C CRISPR-associated endonuclease Cas1 [Accumulibacter sp.]